MLPFVEAISDQENAKIISVNQGSAVTLTFDLPNRKTPPAVKFNGKNIPVFKLQDPGAFGVLLGIDLAEKPSQYDLTVEEGDRVQKHIIEVKPVTFGVEELNLPEDKVTLDEKTLKQVKKENREILGAMKPVTQEKLWEGSFINPVMGPVSGRFGVRRILNGEPRSPHSGEDFKAPEGTPVKVSNTGRVALTGEYFFTGRSIIVDHGLGCYTMYFHLKDISVQAGDRINKGDVIGTVGATGRATGPHLHWGVRLNGARVNPMTMVTLEPVGGF